MNDCPVCGRQPRGKWSFLLRRLLGSSCSRASLSLWKGLFSCVRERTYDLQGADWGLQGEQGPGSPGHMQGGRGEPVLLPATCWLFPAPLPGLPRGLCCVPCRNTSTVTVLLREFRLPVCQDEVETASSQVPLGLLCLSHTRCTKPPV